MKVKMNIVSNLITIVVLVEAVTGTDFYLFRRQIQSKLRALYIVVSVLMTLFLSAINRLHCIKDLAFTLSSFQIFVTFSSLVQRKHCIDAYF
jgi:hypothetical protein